MHDRCALLVEKFFRGRVQRVYLHISGADSGVGKGADDTFCFYVEQDDAILVRGIVVHDVAEPRLTQHTSEQVFGAQISRWLGTHLRRGSALSRGPVLAAGTRAPSSLTDMLNAARSSSVMPRWIGGRKLSDMFLACTRTNRALARIIQPVR